MFRNRYGGLLSGLIVAAFCAFGLPSPAAEAAVVLHTQTTEHTTIFNFCTNNTDTVTGVVDLNVTETFAADGSLHVTIHGSSHDNKTNDPLLGNCEGEFPLDIAINLPPDTASITQTANTSLRIACGGPGGTLDATFTLPITVFSDGAVIPGSETLTGVECR